MLAVRFGDHLEEVLGACWRLEGYFGRSVGALGLLGETFGAPLGASGSSSGASTVLGETLDGPLAFRSGTSMGATEEVILLHLCVRIDWSKRVWHA